MLIEGNAVKWKLYYFHHHQILSYWYIFPLFINMCIYKHIKYINIKYKNIRSLSIYDCIYTHTYNHSKNRIPLHILFGNLKQYKFKDAKIFSLFGKNNKSKQNVILKKPFFSRANKSYVYGVRGESGYYFSVRKVILHFTITDLQSLQKAMQMFRVVTAASWKTLLW